MISWMTVFRTMSWMVFVFPYAQHPDDLKIAKKARATRFYYWMDTLLRSESFLEQSFRYLCASKIMFLSTVDSRWLYYMQLCDFKWCLQVWGSQVNVSASFTQQQQQQFIQCSHIYIHGITYFKGATSRITHLEKIGKFFQVCHS